MPSRHTFHWRAWIVGGTALGGALGIGIAWAAMIYSQREAPTDSSAGSVGIIVVATFPLGLLAGFLAGLFAAHAFVKKPTSQGFAVMTKRTDRNAKS